jgi:hypothetical protein
MGLNNGDTVGWGNATGSQSGVTIPDISTLREVRQMSYNRT